MPYPGPLSLGALALCVGGSVQSPIPIRELLAVERLGSRSRSALYTDSLESQIARGEWLAPEAGDTITSTSGETRTWTPFDVNDEGWFEGVPFSGGWAIATVDVPEAGPWRLDATGHALVLVDGEAHVGDHYGLGITRIPLALDAGPHEFLFRGGRGRLRATLEPAPSGVYFEEKDRTLPDVIRGESGDLALGLIVANATPDVARSLRILATIEGVQGTLSSVPPLLPSSFAKVPVTIDIPRAARDEVRELEVKLELLHPDRDVILHSTTLTLTVVDGNAKHVRTFVSQIDTSVQYFGVTPPLEPRASGERNAMFLSLHGASVEGRRQAFSYEPKADGVVIAPTNRRSFGFDWEDWGRLDALEVLSIAEDIFDTDPRRTYLTGHSMGGHGTWQLGAHFPDRFAAIAPSAGWSDFWSYTGLAELPQDDPIGAYLARSINASRTLLLRRNLVHGGVYILHGDADDNVPVNQARNMRRELASFHPNFAYYERAGAGHWWGNQCMDWPPLFAFLRENVTPAPTDVLEVDFTTVNPAISSTCHWLAVESQLKPMEPTHVHARLDVESRTIQLESENLGRISFDLTSFTQAQAEQPALLASDGPLHLVIGEERQPLTRGKDDRWRVGHPGPEYRHARRNGPFKQAFRNRMLFVYGTQGTPEENDWARNKARLDHERWRYRGNGFVQVVADTEFLPELDADRNVILYGNADTNRAWTLLLDAHAFEVRRDFVRVGERTVTGDDLALLAVYPRKGSDVASVAVISGTGLPGCHTTDHLPYFVSGVGYPDWTVLGTEFLTKGLEGVRGAGFFADDWSAGDGAEATWR